MRRERVAQLVRSGRRSVPAAPPRARLGQRRDGPLWRAKVGLAHLHVDHRQPPRLEPPCPLEDRRGGRRGLPGRGGCGRLRGRRRLHPYGLVEQQVEEAAGLRLVGADLPARAGHPEAEDLLALRVGYAHACAPLGLADAHGNVGALLEQPYHFYGDLADAVAQGPELRRPARRSPPGRRLHLTAPARPRRRAARGRRPRATRARRLPAAPSARRTGRAFRAPAARRASLPPHRRCAGALRSRRRA